MQLREERSHGKKGKRGEGKRRSRNRKKVKRVHEKVADRALRMKQPSHRVLRKHHQQIHLLLLIRRSARKESLKLTTPLMGNMSHQRPLRRLLTRLNQHLPGKTRQSGVNPYQKPPEG